MSEEPEPLLLPLSDVPGPQPAAEPEPRGPTTFTVFTGPNDVTATLEVPDGYMAPEVISMSKIGAVIPVVFTNEAFVPTPFVPVPVAEPPPDPSTL